MHQLEMEAMLRSNGVYIIGDTRHPKFTMPVVVAGANEEQGTPGIMHALICGRECPQDAGQWAQSATIAGGPFSIESCDRATRIDELRELEWELHEHELETWRGLVEKSMPIYIFARNALRILKHPEAEIVSELIQKIEEIKIAERIAEQIRKETGTPCILE